VYKGEPSSSFVVLVGGQPLLLADVGAGVVRAYHRHLPDTPLPPNIYVSHNHTDHAGELPVVLAVEASRGARPRLLAHRRVMARLRDHRLHELLSTGHPLDHFARMTEVPEAGEGRVEVGHGLSLATVHTRHSELCYGALLYLHGAPLLGWTADSGYEPRVYAALSEAPLVVVDARRGASPEHAGFAEVARLARAPHMAGRTLLLTGYGSQGVEAPDEGEVAALGESVVVARPGLRLVLAPAGQAARSPDKCEAALCVA